MADDQLTRPDYVAHICQSVGEHVYAFLHCGWAMTRIAETGGHRQSASLDSFIAERLPITTKYAHSAGSAWAAVLALLRASGDPMDKTDDWEACRLAIGKVLPDLTTDAALVAFRPVIQRPVPLMLKVWDRSVELSEQTDTKELTARQVNRARRELEPAPSAPEPDTSNAVPRADEESAAELSDRALGHLTRGVRDVCKNVALAPEVAAAIIEGAALRQIASEVDLAKNHLEAILDREICSQLEIDRILSLLAEARRKLMYGKPFAPCPYCWQQGRANGNCDACRPSVESKPLGWVNRNKWGSAPEDLRKGCA